MRRPNSNPSPNPSRLALAIAVSILAAGCATTGSPGAGSTPSPSSTVSTTASEGPEAVVAASPVATVDAGASAEPEPTDAATRTASAIEPAERDSVIETARPLARRQGEIELAIWNSPAFRKQFVESYLAETEVEPSVTLIERETMQEVLDFMSSDKVDRAIRLLEKNRGRGASAVFDFTLANIYFQDEDFERAIDIYRDAVEKFPRFRRAWKNMGLIHVRLGDFDQAIESLTRVIELGGGDAITYGLLGVAYSNDENDLSAESAFRQAVLLDPETVDWKMGLARSFFRQRRFADAIALFDVLIAERPEKAEYWLLQANAFIGLGQPLRAAENYEMVDGLGASTADSLSNLADIYINEKLFDVAVDAYARAMEMEATPKPGRAIRAARVMTANGEHEETKRLVARITEHYGDDLADEDRKSLLKLRSRIAVAEGAGDEEARILEEIVALDPLDGEAILLLGQHAARDGKTEQAVYYYERAAALEDFEADAKVRHAELLVREGNYAAALPMLRRAQALKPREYVQEFLDSVERLAKGR